MLSIRKIFWTGFVGLWVSVVAAQADCPTIVQTALDATDKACADTGRNQACYGNVNLQAVAQEGVPAFQFDAPGDIIDVAGVKTLQLEPLDAASDVWGIALMRLQANLPETLPGQNVTFLLFGDVEIRNGVSSNVEPEATPASEAETPFTPMQAFYFQSGISDAPCSAAPDSGILIQTPDGAGEISFRINDVDIQLGSTAYIQAQPDAEMTVNVVEHEAIVTAQGVSQTVPAGSRVRVPLDANLSADGEPSAPEPYVDADLAALPVGHLPRKITVAPALTQAELDALSAGALPTSGTWFYDVPEASLSGSCDPSVPDTPPPSRDITLNVGEDFNAGTILQAISPNFDFPDDADYENPEPGFYTADYTETSGDVFHMEVRFTSPTEAEGSSSLVFNGCTFATNFTLTAE
jgi:hypothetical protein